jgi:hypothetical protein
MKEKLRLSESDLVRLIRKVINEQSNTSMLDINTIKQIFKSKGVVFKNNPDYLMYGTKTPSGSTFDQKTGKYAWNYEIYIPKVAPSPLTGEGSNNKLWVVKSRGRSPYESVQILIDLNGPTHQVLTKINGKITKKENLSTSDVISMLNQYN